MEADYGRIEEDDGDNANERSSRTPFPGTRASSSSVAALFPCSVDLSGVLTRTQAKVNALLEAEESQHHCDDDTEYDHVNSSSSSRGSRHFQKAPRHAARGGGGSRQQDQRQGQQQRRQHPARQKNSGNAPTKWENCGPRRGKRGKPRTYGDGMMIFYQRVSTTPLQPPQLQQPHWDTLMML